MIRRLVLSLALLAPAGCGGGTGGNSVAPPVSTPAPHVTATPGNASTSATLRIVIPTSSATSSSKARSPKYISFATQSIKIVFTPTAGGTATTVTQNLTPTSPGCQGGLSASTTCSVQLLGLAGTYSADFTLYDGLLDGNNVPTGNVLSATLGVPETITAGQANIISVTLNGVPTAVAVLPSANSTLSGSQHAGYTLSSCFAAEPAGTEGITVVGLDADGNIIVGAGAPTPALTSSNTAMATVSTPSATSPNAFVLNGPATPATPGTSFTLSATVTPLAGSPNTTPIAASIPITFVSCPTPAPTPTPVPPPLPSTAVTLNSDITSPVVGQALTFTAGVVVLAPGTGSPTGTVTFLDGSNTITGCSAQPLNAGAATCTAILTAGTHSITATYSGDAAFLTSTSLAFTQLVNRAATLVVLTSDNDPSLVGQSVTFTASLAVSAPGAGTPTGVLAFKDNGAILSGCAAQPISSGAATCTTSVLLASAQPRSITATYSGDTNFIGSVSLTFSQTVNKAPSSVSLNASQPGGAGAAVQFDVAVTVTGAIRSTGTVNITTQAAPATTIATCTLSVATGLCSANATVATGTTTFVARYLGDTNYIGSTGNSAALTVQSVHRAH